MPTVDELFAAYCAAYRAGEADPAPYLEQADGADRAELEALIDGFLVRAPAPAFDAAAFASFQSEPLTERIQRDVAARLTETWATLLPAERDRAEIPRSTLVERLARALGVGDREAKVAGYYHRMETGTLPGRGVSDRVLEALSQIIDIPVARLRAAGERMAPPPPMAAGGGGPVFARSAPRWHLEADLAAAPRPEPERDEVDELFTGG